MVRSANSRNLLRNNARAGHGFARHNIATREPVRKDRIIAGINFGKQPAPTGYRYLVRFYPGTDVFSRQSDGTTMAQQYLNLGLRMTSANVDRLNGWAEILTRLGDPDHG